MSPSPDLELQHAFEMLRVDFEKRSDQVVQLNLDRARFLRIALLIWGAPLAIAAAFLGAHDPGAVLVAGMPSQIIIAFAFVLSGLVNCTVLAAMRGNLNTTLLAAGGMNFIRALYFRVLVARGLVEPDDGLRRILGPADSGVPRFRLAKSHSATLKLQLVALVNLLYSSLGCVYGCLISTESLLVTLPFLGVTIGAHWKVFRIRPLAANGFRE